MREGRMVSLKKSIATLYAYFFAAFAQGRLAPTSASIPQR
jgi:hypothetical protein